MELTIVACSQGSIYLLQRKKKRNKQNLTLELLNNISFKALDTRVPFIYLLDRHISLPF